MLESRPLSLTSIVRNKRFDAGAEGLGAILLICWFSTN